VVLTPMPTCTACGGWAPTLSGPGISEPGVHNLCHQLRRLGRPTPNLGDKCPACNGSGTNGRGGVPLFLELGPAAIAKSIHAQFTRCKLCHGRGTVPHRQRRSAHR
jgi:hypothetical protein